MQVTESSILRMIICNGNDNDNDNDNDNGEVGEVGDRGECDL